jgi:capsid protein
MSRLTLLTNGVKSIGKALGFSSSRHYEGSERHSRHRGYVWNTAQDADKDLTPTERKDGMAISRLLAANSGLYRGACQLLGRYAVVGMPQSQSSNRKWAQQAEDAFAEWAKIPEVTGRLTWLDIQRLWNTSCDRDGDMGNILTDSDFPQLQLVEAHRIESDYTDTGWIDGVRVNKVGRAVAYRVKNGDSYSDIPAASFLLVGEPSRATGTRHEPAWIAGLNHVRDTKEIGGLLKTVIKNEASIALIRKLNGGTLNDVAVNDWGTGTSPTGSVVNQLLENIYGGRIPVLDVNEEIQSLATDRPSPNIQAFLEFIIRDFATGNGIPFEVVWNPEKLGGTAQRWVIASFQRRVNERQLLIERHATRIYGWVVAKLAKRGDIPTLPTDWYRVRWQKPAEVTVDVGREQAQDRADFQAGLIDPYEFYSRQGLDADDVMVNRARWAKRIMELAEREGVPANMLYQSTPNGNQPQPTEPQPKEEPKP